jgi:two-component system sensor histidine kinase KdpD
MLITGRSRNDVLAGTLALLAIAVLTVLLRSIRVANPTTVALGLLLVVLGTAALARLRVAIVTSVAAMLAFNFFFLPPVGTFTIADPQNWIALFAFLAVAVIASNLSAAAQDREREALARRHEVTRLFDLSRDVLLTTETAGALDALARHIARRFELPQVAICLPGTDGWRIHQGGEERVKVSTADLEKVLANARATLEFDARQRAYGGTPRSLERGRRR